MQQFLHHLKNQLTSRWSTYSEFLKANPSDEYKNLFMCNDYNVIKLLPPVKEGKDQQSLILPKSYTEEKEECCKDYMLGLGKTQLRVFSRNGNIPLSENLLLVHNTNFYFGVNIECLYALKN